MCKYAYQLGKIKGDQQYAADIRITVSIYANRLAIQAPPPEDDDMYCHHACHSYLNQTVLKERTLFIESRLGDYL